MTAKQVCSVHNGAWRTWVTWKTGLLNILHIAFVSLLCRVMHSNGKRERFKVDYTLLYIIYILNLG